MCLLTPYFVNAYYSLNSILCNSATASYRPVSAPCCISHAYQFYIDTVGLVLVWLRLHLPISHSILSVCTGTPSQNEIKTAFICSNTNNAELNHSTQGSPTAILAGTLLLLTPLLSDYLALKSQNRLSFHICISMA